MKNYLFSLLALITLLSGCAEMALQDQPETRATEIYSGPIIDMHIQCQNLYRDAKSAILLLTER